MKPKTVVLLAIAVGSGLLAMIGVQQAMSGGQSEPVETVKVAMALVDVDIGMPLSEENVGFQEMPKSAVTFNDPVMTVEQYSQRSPLLPIKTGDIIRVSRLSEPGDTGKSLQIPKGMRVLTITVDKTAAQAGLLRPGDRVDVMVTYASRTNSGRQNTKTTTLLEYVEVFATDDRTASEAKTSTEEGKNSTSTIGLLLAPENVPYVQLAQSKGKLALAWRRRDDDELAQVGPVNEELLNELRGLDGMGDRPGYDQLSTPLYGEGEDGSGFTPAPIADFGGIGRPADQAAAPPAVAAAAPPAAAPGFGGMNAMLTNAENASALPAPVAAPTAAAPTPPKPTWKLQIYSGNQAVAQEFEIPEPEVSEQDVKAVEDAAGGGQLWSLLKQAL